MREFIRRCVFKPYRPGHGPRFTLTLWDTGRLDSMGKWVIAYRLTSSDAGTVFDAEDFCCPTIHAIDADETVRCLMSFLTLRPGDTDADYFADYTEAQRDYCNAHAETLSLEVMNRFGEG